MQTLYAIDSLDKNDNKSDPAKVLKGQFQQTRNLFLYLINVLAKTAQYVETDARNRASKHLPSAEDLSVNTKLAGNLLLWKILENESYSAALKDSNVALLDDKEIIRKLFHLLEVTEEYKAYTAIAARDKKSEKDILLFIFNYILLPNELFIGFVEENFANWDDDNSMLIQLMGNFLSKPQSFNFLAFISAEKEKFATGLLETAIEKEEYIMNLIRPKLKNWDADRIALLDMLLMRLGVSEFLYFDTIPPKVTINEYIDIAKEYSTQQSGQFVNGILDNIHKELIQQNKMHKVNFK